MARTKGSQNKITIAVKDAVEQAFNTVNRDGKYLVNLANDHPAVFCSLVSKCIPTAVAVDIKHSLDLGAAMLEASQRLQQFNSTIDHEPISLILDTQQLATLEPDSLEPDSLEPDSLEPDSLEPDSLEPEPGA
jgi:hypothetical protein